MSTTTPPFAQISVALDALRHDAARWADAATELRRAATAAAGLRLDPAAFSFAGGRAAATYASLQAKLAVLLDAGAANFASVDSALRASADTYSAEEAAGVHRLRGIY